MKTYTYEEARDLIRDGDIVSVHRRRGSLNPFHLITNIVTNSPIYHSAVATWLKTEYGHERLFVIEAASGGRRLIPMSCYSLDDMDVIACPFDFSTVADDALAKVHMVPYGYIDLIVIGIKELFGLPAKDVVNAEVCSEFAAKTWKAGGVNIEDTVLSPAKLQKVLTEDLGLDFRCNIRATK